LRVDLLFVDDPTLRGLHEKFLDDPTVTDVMAFDYSQADESQLDPEAEVYVSVDRARAVALERGVQSRDELLLYIVHGSLHLCGFDDHTDEDRDEMRAAERAVLASLS
jgi:probable rRNA maturation factor